MRYRIKNWTDFQHYKDRAPAWIKLHSSLLTSELWVMGSDASRTLAIACMLLASRNKASDGTFNGDPEYVKRFAYLNGNPDFKPLIQYGFIECLQDASSAQAFCTTEERREEERKEEPAPAKAAAFNPKSRLEGLGVNVELIADFLAIRKAKQKPLTETAVKAIIRECEKAGWSVEQAVTVCCERGWQSFQAKYVENEKPAAVKPASAIPFDREAYEAKRKAELKAARERYMAQEAEATVPVVRAAQ